MRYRLAFSMMSLAVLVLMLGPSALLAQKGKGKGFGGQGGGPGGFGGGFGGGPGGFGGGGFGGGGFGGFGGTGFGGTGFGGTGFGGKGGNAMAMANSPDAIFDALAKGRNYFLASESGRLAQALNNYLVSKGNNTGQVTRDAFTSFYEQMTGGMAGGRGGFAMQGKGMMQAGGFGGFGGGGGNPLANMSALAESEFKFYDQNGDGVLSVDEMPPQLRAELNQWDKDHNNMITLDEYVQYYGNRMLARGRGGFNQMNPVNIMIVEEEDLDTRPVVYRGGKLPTTGLPGWFAEMADKNGQVSLYAWYKEKGEVDEFREWDRNDDGYITAEEAMSRQRAMGLADYDDDGNPLPKMGKGKGKGGPGGAKGKGGKGAGGFGGFGGGDFADFGGGGKGKGGKGGGKGGKGGKGGFGGGGPGGFGGFGAGSFDEETVSKIREFMANKKKGQSEE